MPKKKKERERMKRSSCQEHTEESPRIGKATINTSSANSALRYFNNISVLLWSVISKKYTLKTLTANTPYTCNMLCFFVFFFLNEKCAKITGLAYGISLQLLKKLTEACT